MKNKSIIFLFVITYLFIFEGKAQQDLLFTQQVFSRININPAATGNTADVDIFLLGRLQWLGVDNSPRTTMLNVTNYIEKIHSGVGLSVSYDKLGIGHSSTDIKAAYSFQIDLNEHWILAMGLSAGAFIGTYDPLANSLDDESERDEEDYAKETEVSPDINLGFELNSLDWSFGLSCTHLLNNESTSYSSDRHLYSYIVKTLTFNDQWDLMIDMAYMNRNKTHLGELGILGYYNRFIWGGAAWRPDIVNKFNPSYLSFLIGFEYKIVRFGYVYELGMGSNSTLPSNTHEIILSFRVPKNIKSKFFF